MTGKSAKLPRLSEYLISEQNNHTKCQESVRLNINRNIQPYTFYINILALAREIHVCFLYGYQRLRPFPVWFPAGFRPQMTSPAICSVCSVGRPL